MGAQSSTAASIPYFEEFRKWSPTHVKRAWRRAYHVCAEFINVDEALPFGDVEVAPTAASPSTVEAPGAPSAFQRAEQAAAEQIGAAFEEAAGASRIQKVARKSMPLWVSRESRVRLAQKSRVAGMQKPLLVTRRDFLEVFTDITALHNGHFLTLPMTVFDAFGEDETRDKPTRGKPRKKTKAKSGGKAGSGKRDAGKRASGDKEPKISYCDCRIVLLAITMCCNASMSEVAALLFNVYDVDSSGQLCPVRLIGSSLRVLVSRDM